jgi:hypothetical protein
VANISDIDWSPRLDCLALPAPKKDVIVSLAGSRLCPAESGPFDDFVSGKGRGLIILLQYAPKALPPSGANTKDSGPSGVGKTLTAEVISEHFKRPLYSVRTRRILGSLCSHFRYLPET